MINESKINFVYFGSSRLSVIVLDELKKLGLIPALIVTSPDKPQGRKLVMTPNIVKTWAIQNHIAVNDPAKLDSAYIEELRKIKADVFIVASYGKLIPSAIVSMPPRKVLNIHPSLLPKYRGPSPLPTAILDNEKRTGVSIMRIDEQMDHGPVVAQKEITVEEWPTYERFEEMMAVEGARLLAEILPKWITGEIQEKEQDHAKATYTRKYSKEDALIDLKSDPYENFRKIQAFHEWPQAYFLVEHQGRNMRVKITSASFTDDVLKIEKVIPEGKNEMSFESFLQGYKMNS